MILLCDFLGDCVQVLLGKKKNKWGKKQHLKKKRDLFFFFFYFLACAFYIVPERKVNKVMSLSVLIKTTCGEEKTGRHGVGGALWGSREAV